MQSHRQEEIVHTKEKKCKDIRSTKKEVAAERMGGWLSDACCQYSNCAACQLMN